MGPKTLRDRSIESAHADPWLLASIVPVLRSRRQAARFPTTVSGWYVVISVPDGARETQVAREVIKAADDGYRVILKAVGDLSRRPSEYPGGIPTASSDDRYTYKWDFRRRGRVGEEG